jgi:hypothetical protein
MSVDQMAERMNSFVSGPLAGRGPDQRPWFAEPEHTGGRAELPARPGGSVPRVDLAEAMADVLREQALAYGIDIT